MERTLVLLKPDAVARRLVGQIIARFEAKGLWIVGMKHMMMTQEIADAHYAEHKEKPFFKDLCQFMTSSPLVALVLEGPAGTINLVRTMVGKTKVSEAQPGTIRGDFAASTQQNLIHASDSPESAQRELAIWFKPEELTDYKPCDGIWVTEEIA